MCNIFEKKGWLLGGIIILLLTSCSTEPQKSLRVGTNLWPGYETLYLARDLGFFEEASIRLVELASATSVLQAFRNGVLEVAALTLDETLTLLQTEPDLRVILIMDYSDGADALLSKPSIQQLSDLKGQRIAVENSAVGAIILSRALEVAGLSIDKVKVIPATVDQHLELYLAGKVDAVVTFDPVRAQLINEGANLLFDSSQIPEQIVDVLVTRKALLDSRPKELKTLVDGHFRALNYLYRNRDDALKRMAPRLAITLGELDGSYKGIILPGRLENQKLMNGPNAELKKTTEELMFMMLERKLLYKKPYIGELITGRFL